MIFRRGSADVFPQYPHLISGCWPCRRSHTVLCLSTFLHRWVLAQLPRFLLMCLFRLPYAVRCYTMLPHNYRSRSSLLDVSSRTILWTAKTLIVSPRHRYKTILVVSSPPLICTLTRSSLDCDDLVRTLAPRALLQPPPRLEQYAPPAGLAVDAHLCTPHGIPVTAAPLRPGLRSANFSHAPTAPLLVPSMWDHTILVQPLQAREVPVPPWWERTILLIQMLVQGLFLFLNRVPSFFLWSTLVTPNLKGTVVLIQPTAISCIINSVSLSFSGIQGRRARTTNILAAACGKFHAVFRQEASDHVPHISDQFIFAVAH